MENDMGSDMGNGIEIYIENNMENICDVVGWKGYACSVFFYSNSPQNEILYNICRRQEIALLVGEPSLLFKLLAF